ncbi:MAG: glycosyltransferase [Candidatus Helarchaeota archaeon]
MNEIYGEYLSKNHNIYIIIYKYGAGPNIKDYVWKDLHIYEITNRNFIINLLQIHKLITFFYQNLKLDLIQVRNPDFSLLFLFLFKQKLKIPLVFQYTFPPINRISKSRIKSLKEKMYHRILDFFQIQFAKKADLILSISEWMRYYLISRGISKSKIFNFPDGINNKKLTSFEENEINSIAESINFRENHILIYVGTLDKIRKLDFLVFTMKHVIKEIKNVKLLIIGKGTGEIALKNLIFRLNLQEYVILLGYLPYDQVNTYISISSIGLSVYPDYYFYKLVSPIKLYEYMGMGKPVVANMEIPAHRNAIEKAKCGLLAEYSPQKFATAIVKLLRNPSVINEMGENGKRWVFKNRSYEKISLTIEIKYNQLMKIKS